MEILEFEIMNIKDDFMRLINLLLFKPENAETIREELEKLSPEIVDNYSFLRILRDASDFEESIDIARDDLLYELKERKNGSYL